MSLPRNELCVLAILLTITASAMARPNANKTHASPAAPMVETDRSLERTGFQQAGRYDPRFDLRTDFVMDYGVGPTMADTLKRWGEAGYVLQAMTGVAWGSYQDYLDGKVDGRRHWDEGPGRCGRQAGNARRRSPLHGADHRLQQVPGRRNPAG